MKRICIIGACGSGKSTLALALKEKLQLPLFHIDQIFWQANWQEIGTEKLITTLQEIMTTNQQWIIDGNYGSSLDIRLQQADTVIFLDYPRFIYFPRVIKRYLQYHGKVRADMASGCIEKFDVAFLKFVWHFNKTSRPKILKALNNMPVDCQLVQLTSPKATAIFLKNL